MTTDTMTTDPAAPAGPDVNHPEAVTVHKLRILHDYLVVRPLAVPSKARGSLLHMPDNASERERSHRGVVMQLGPGDWNEPGTARVPMSVQAGDLVFFGKFAGTEEEIGGQTVLVMRESECRMSVPADTFLVVSHDNPKLDHLIEDWCEVCHGIPLEQAAKETLALEREAALVGRRPGIVEQMTNEGSIGTGPDRNAPSVEEVNASIGPLNAVRTERGLSTVVPFVTAALDDRRPCVGDSVPCSFMQRKYETADGPIWLGLRCGHWHCALSVEG